MKRIIIVITNDIARDRRMLRTSKTLVEMGYQVTVINQKLTKGNRPESTFPRKDISCWFSRGFAFYTEFNIRAFILLLFAKKDIILSVDSDTLLACSLASRIQRKKLVIDMHELFSEVPELAKKSFKKSIWKSIENICIPLSHERYTVSQTIAKKLLERTGHPFDVIRNTPDKQSTKIPIHKKERFTIAYLGVLNIGRGIEELILAIKDMSDVDLMIIGDGDIGHELKALTNRLSLSDRVTFLGWQDPNKIHDLLRTAHVGVNLLDSSSESYYLSLANKYFDYIHAALPILTMNFPEYQHLNNIYRTCLLLDDLNPASISDAIAELKLQQNTYKELKNNCLTTKEEWNWNNESERLKSIFKEIETK